MHKWRGLQNFQLFYSLHSNYCGFLKPKVGPNILPTSTIYHNHSFLLTLTLKTKTWHYWFQLDQNHSPTLLKLQFPINCWWDLDPEYYTPQLQRALNRKFSQRRIKPMVWTLVERSLDRFAKSLAGRNVVDNTVSIYAQAMLTIE
jgi:hypothetical protein